MKHNFLKKRSFALAVEIIYFYQKLLQQKEYVIAKQLLRSGTSVGANISESHSAQSKRDFLNKLEIALKEARKTEYWLQLLDETNLTKIDCKQIIESTEQMIKLLVTSVNTVKTKLIT
ncbi:MAG: four helix bundle protein [Candidatus Abawacabacteria bacterium]|nr:four helix bundle protein [Candidatus Abawacabacteria bacterium]